MSVDCLERRRYAALVELGSSPPAALKGTKSEASAALASPPGFDIPTNTVQENGTYGGQGKAVGVSHPAALLFVALGQTLMPNAETDDDPPGSNRTNSCSSSWCCARRHYRHRTRTRTLRHTYLGTRRRD